MLEIQQGEKGVPAMVPSRVRDALMRARIARARETLDETEARAYESMLAEARMQSE